MSQSLTQRSFAGGELAPALYGRADQTKYQTGLKTLRNFTVLKHGGVANRMGTRHVSEVKDSTKATYMLKFIFNDDQTYVIEMGNEYLRFYRNKARIIVSGVAAYNGATTYALAALVVSGGINYYSLQDGNVGHTPASSPTWWYPLTGVIYEIPTPYQTADLARLQFVQSGDVVTITHTGYDTLELTRNGHTTWFLIAKAYQPSISAPTSVTNSNVGGGGDKWVVTAIATESYEESIASSVTESINAATSGTPITVTWANVTGAQEYFVYKVKNGIFGFIGVAATGVAGFKDTGITQDMTVTPPVPRNPFSGAGNRAGSCSYYQQRLLLANQLNAPEKLFGSRSGMFNNFTISSPLQDDDAVTFTVAGRKVNEVRHLVDIGTLVLFTASGEWLVEGDQDGVLRANQPPNLRQIGYNGSSPIMPVIVNDSVVYAQARGSIVRDLRYQVTSKGGQASYKGNDLSIFAGHLFTNKTLARMDFAQIPNSIIWITRTDGALLGLTYLTDHEVWGWHRHDTDGTFEDVCSVPEEGADAVYVIVKRTINGQTKRYIERFGPRDFTDIQVDATFMDSFLTYDGRNTTTTTLTLSTAAGWTVDDEITVTAAVGTPFVAGDVGNDFVLTIGADTVAIRVTSYTSNVVVRGAPSKTVPATLRGTATTTWTRAVDSLAGLDHLEGKDVSVFGDGNVVANPNNEDYTTVTVASGAIQLDRPYGIIHVGLPYLSDFETLDLDLLGKEIRDLRKDITHISLLVESTRGIFAGPDFDTLDELQSEPINTYGGPWPLKTGLVEMPIASTWNATGSFAVRQKDPLPITILSAIPSGDIGG